MPFDAYLRVRVGELAPVYGSATAQPGATMTIATSPAPTFQVLNVDDTPATGFSAPVAVSGYDAGALAFVRVWYDLDYSALTRRQYYIGQFIFTGVGSDGITRRYISRILLMT